MDAITIWIIKGDNGDWDWIVAHYADKAQAELHLSKLEEMREEWKKVQPPTAAKLGEKKAARRKFAEQHTHLDPMLNGEGTDIHYTGYHMEEATLYRHFDEWQESH